MNCVTQFNAPVDIQDM